jgi:hypothetical protein
MGVKENTLLHKTLNQQVTGLRKTTIPENRVHPVCNWAVIDVILVIPVMRFSKELLVN